MATKAERALERIVRQAETLRPNSEAEDEQMYYLIGGIIANAEDALGAIRAERESAKLSVVFEALRRGNVTFSGTPLPSPEAQP